MRRSKSNPAKYARNYRSISQRRMTEHDGVDEEQEIERLRNILQTSESHLQRAKEQSHQQPNRSRYGRTKRKRSGSDADKTMEEDPTESLLSEEMKEQMGIGGYGEDDTALILPKKKKPKKSKTVELTPQEIRQAKVAQKNANRKLKQLTMRAEQKKKRAGLYSKLQQTAISPAEMELLSSSSTLGKRETKKETLKRLLQRERAGVPLTEQEQSILYMDRNEGEQVQDIPGKAVAPKPNQWNETPSAASTSKRKRPTDVNNVEPRPADQETGPDPVNQGVASTVRNDAVEGQREQTTEKVTTTNVQTPETRAATNFAAQMMASLTTLKVQTVQQQVKKDSKPMSELERIGIKEEKRKEKDAVYVPTNSAILKSAAVIGLEPRKDSRSCSRQVVTITRPEEVQEKRYDLPVCGMEFEIVDAIRNNDVTILCSETGSGKSTQVPQFLYEAGFSLNSKSASGNDMLIGITQPRRVAAVSTAKRVCYEMGRGNGQSIQGKAGKGNLVAYQTRYETAGLGGNTRVKFMTDGILLQEIQSDLLLRKYCVIILDEAHERNLNTDVLLGLLSVAIPLRRKAAEEEGSDLVPLKLVVMSATLRVADFTANEKLFPTIVPAVIKVPGRTHPVTIHHSKVTELDDYETAAFSKICKIHRKLPKGGILVFLTGKQEIVRMVNKLRKALGQKKHGIQFSGGNDVSANFDVTSAEIDGALRDLDDDEVDGEVFQDEHDDFDDVDDESDEDTEIGEDVSNDVDDDIPRHAHVLPLYSMLSVEEQAKVFANVPDGHRLIVVATNIAETSLTIPGISYVVDTGRQKCRNFHAGTGVASYDIMWISKAAADQRAGRAGRTGPGHCYRLYSSSMYARHMDEYAMPEVLTRPLEDVVLAMKAMNVLNVANFPFPTSPDQSQIDAAVRLLADLGCVDVSSAEEKGGDGSITKLGRAVAKLPLGVRYGKMLLIAAQAGVLDYAIGMVAVLSENSPFLHGQRDPTTDSNESETKGNAEHVKEDIEHRKDLAKKWKYRSGDILAGLLAVGAYTYAGRGAGGSSEKLACRQFCEENGLCFPVMERIQKIRIHLARLAKTRLSKADGVAARTGGIVSTMAPPNKLQENLLCQAIASGLLDNIAMLAPPGSLSGDHPYSFQSAYLSCSVKMKEPLFIDPQSALASRDWRRLPQWVCYDTIVRKTAKDGTPVASMKNLTRVDPAWLGQLASGSHLLSLDEPLNTPLPSYSAEKDAVLCSVRTKFGSRGWEIPPLKVEMYEALANLGKQSSHFLLDDSFRWFARFLLEGKVLLELQALKDHLNDDPMIITRKTPVRKVALLVSALSSAGVDSAGALRKHWAEVDNKFLFKHLKSWTKPDCASVVKKLWMDVVKTNVT